MTTRSKKTAFRITAVGGMSLLVAAAIAPGAIAAGTIDGDVKVSNTETVQVLMDATGKIASQRVYDQLVLTGKGNVDLANPVSTKGLRNLDGFGGYDVRDGKVRVKTDVDGTKKFRSVSDFTKKLPLDISVGYFLDGKKVNPGDVVGKSGDLEVRYRVTNNTGVDQDVPFKNGMGADMTSKESVVIPIVGSLTTTLPSNFTKVKSKEANAAGDGRGGTSLSFTMTLIPPIGKNFADFGYTAHVTDGFIPKATISALPINPLESPSFSGAAASYKGGATTGADLTAGATEIDANVLKLRDGANELVAGLLQLQAGAGQLSAGLNNDAAPGARKLADGANKLDAGAGKIAAGTGDLNAGANKLNTGAGKLSAGAGDLNAGAGKLSVGLKTAGEGAPALLGGIDKLTAGAQLVDAGLTTLNGQVVPGANQINGGATQLLGALDTQLIAGLGGALDFIAVATGLASQLPLSPQQGAVVINLGSATSLVGQVRAGLNTTVRGGLTQIRDGSALIRDGVDAQTSAGAAATDGTLKNGMAQLIGGLGELKVGGLALVDGLGQLSAGADPLAAGTGQLSAGADKLAAGTGDLTAGTSKLSAGAETLKGGTGQLSAGASLLSDGLGAAATGSSQLADGLNQAAASAPALPAGADRLSKEGTKKLIAAGDKTASDYGLKYALLAAGAERALTAQPYGSPEGATALTAYKFELAGADDSGSANAKRGIAAIALLAGTAGFATIRRKGLI